VPARNRFALCGASFSKSKVSSLCADLDPRVRAFNERRLTASYLFVLVDTLVLTVREDDRVVSKAALIASGIRTDGVREILDIQIADSESFSTGRTSSRVSRLGFQGGLVGDLGQPCGSCQSTDPFWVIMIGAIVSSLWASFGA